MELTNQNKEEQEFKLVPLGERFAARLFDGIFEGIIIIPLILLRSHFKSHLKYYLILGIIILIFEFLIPVLTGGRTLGKALTQFRIVKTNGDKVDVFSLFIRSLIYSIVPFLILIPGFIKFLQLIIVIFFIVSMILINYSKRHQSLHDMLAGTIVIFNQ